jgi:KGK domain
MIDMSENFNLSDCADEDVISFGENVYKVGKLRRVLKASGNSSMGQQLLHQLQSLTVKIDDNCFRNGKVFEYENLFGAGIDCEILAVGAKEWKKGKVKIKMAFEFYLEDDESDDNSTMSESEMNQSKSPLDDLREKLKIIENQ